MMTEGRRPGRKILEVALWLALVGFLGFKMWPQMVAALNVGEPGDHVPSFAATTLGGDSITLEGFRGNVVLVNFWATWCPPCRLEMPGFERVYRAKKSEGFVIVGLSTDRGPASVEDFISERGITFPVAMATRESRLVFGGVRGLPVSILIDRYGRIRHTVQGIFSEPALRLAVNRLLAETPCDCLLALAAPAAGQQTVLNPAALLSQADTFTLQISGRPVGSQTVALHRVSGGFLFRETTTTPAGGQTTEVRMDSALAMNTVQQDGEMNGQPMRIDVRYSDARAVGTARVPGPEAMVDLVIDAAVPTGVIDDNVLMALLPALPWKDRATFRLPIFESGRNTLVTYTFTVTGREQTEVAGETLEAFRVEVEGTQPLVLHVSAMAPHRLLRLRVVGTPMELILTGGNDL